MDERDVLIRTIIGEAANEGPEGWAAVAHVVKNRAGDPRWPNSIGAVSLQPKQFSAWNEGAGGNDLVRKYNPGDPVYDRVGAVVDQVFSGRVPDNTGGATHYYSPRGMDALVREGSQSNRVPRWLQQEADRRGGRNVTIGGHIFTGRAAGSSGEIAPLTGTPFVPNAQEQTGFTQEQIAAAFATPERQEPAIQVAESAQPMMQSVSAGQVAPYQPQADALTSAMRAIGSLKERRKGLIPWV